jgi:hypothetical protein
MHTHQRSPAGLIDASDVPSALGHQAALKLPHCIVALVFEGATIQCVQHQRS